MGKHFEDWRKSEFGHIDAMENKAKSAKKQKTAPEGRQKQSSNQPDPLATCPLDGAGWCPYPFSTAQLKKRLKRLAAQKTDKSTGTQAWDQSDLVVLEGGFQESWHMPSEQCISLALVAADSIEAKTDWADWTARCWTTWCKPFNTSSVVFEGILEGNAEGWTLGFAIWSPDTRETTKYDDTRLMYLVNSQRSNNQLKFLI